MANPQRVPQILSPELLFHLPTAAQTLHPHLAAPRVNKESLIEDSCPMSRMMKGRATSPAQQFKTGCHSRKNFLDSEGEVPSRPQDREESLWLKVLPEKCPPQKLFSAQKLNTLPLGLEKGQKTLSTFILRKTGLSPTLDKLAADSMAPLTPEPGGPEGHRRYRAAVEEEEERWAPGPCFVLPFSTCP